MNRKTIAILATILGLALLSVAAAEKYYFTPRVGAITDSLTAPGPTFQVRVECRDETGAWLPGAYYEFASRPNGDEAWHTIMTVRHDDPVALPANQIRFVNGQVGYVWMCWCYAVTTDGGRRWSVWDASKIPDVARLQNYGLIEDVALGADGKGTMRLNDLAVARGGPPQLYTVDYGQTWAPPATPN